MSDKLTPWINKQLTDRGWSIRELGRRINVSSAHATRIANGDVVPSFKLCAEIARVFEITHNEVLVMAGILDTRLSDAQFETFRAVIAEIPQEQHEHVLALLRTYAKTPVNNTKP